MSVQEDQVTQAGLSWAEILGQRSPEGSDNVSHLIRAEQACIEAQKEITRCIQDSSDCAEAIANFEAAFAEVDRMRKEVYRMARQ